MAGANNEGQVGKFSHNGSTASTTWTSLTLTNEQISTNSSFSLTASSTGINLPIGRFLIRHQVGHRDYSSGTDDRGNIAVRLRKNGTVIEGSHGSGYVRNDTTNDGTTAEGWAIVNTDQNDWIDLQVIRGSDDQVGILDSTRSKIYIIQLDDDLDFGFYTDSTDTSILGDNSGGSFSVSWNTGATGGTSISLSGSTVTLASNKTYLITCGVGYTNSVTNRTSRTIFPHINNIQVDGIQGQAYSRNANNPYMNPNFMFIHQTDNSPDQLIIKSMGSTDEGSPNISGARAVNSSGLYISEIPNSTDWWFSTDYSSDTNFTVQDLETSGRKFRIASEIFKNSPIADVSSANTIGVTIKRKSTFLAVSNIYAYRYPVGTYTSRLMREAHFVINNVSNYEGSSIKYNRGTNNDSQDVLEMNLCPAAIHQFEYGDTLEVSTTDYTGWDDGGATTGTTHSFPPSLLLLDIETLKPEITVTVSTLVTYTNNLRQDTIDNTPNYGIKKWAGNHGMFAIPGETTSLNKDNNISLAKIQNFYGRYNIAKRDNSLSDVGNRYWYIPISGNYDICAYGESNVILNDFSTVWSVPSSPLPAVQTITGLQIGDRLSSTYPITVYDGSDKNIPAYYSGWSGYKFAYFSDISASASIIMFSMDDNTDISITATGPNYKTSSIESFSVSLPTAHSITAHSCDNDKIHIITSNKPIVCGIYDGINNAGYQLFPMQVGEKLWGSVADNGRCVGIIDKLNFGSTGSYTLQLQGNIGAGLTNQLNITSVSSPSEWFFGSTNSMTATSSGILSAGIYEPSDDLMISVQSYSNLGMSYPAITRKAWGAYYVFNDDVEQITIIAQGSVQFSIYTSSGWKSYKSTLSQLGSSPVYFETINSGTNPNTFDKGGFLMASDPCMVLITDGVDGRERVLMSSNSQSFTFQIPSLVRDIYNDDNQGGACAGSNFYGDIYTDTGDFDRANFFYADSLMTDPLPVITTPASGVEYYADPVVSGTWVISDGKNCELTPIRC